MTRAAPRRPRASSRPRSGSGRRKPKSPARPVRLLALMAAVAASGLGVVFTSNQHREIHTSLEATRHQQDRLLAEHSRLLLERGALTAYQNVERVAEAELEMKFPDEVERISP